MSLASEYTKMTSADFSQYFSFLTKDFGLQMIQESYSTIGGNIYVRILKNQFVQVELAGDQSYFHAEIRKLINGAPCPYSDRENNIGFEDLAVLLTDNNYDHFDYYPSSVGWSKVLENTADLFKRSKEVFTSTKWVDTNRIEELEDEDFFAKFGFRPSENKSDPTFFDLIKGFAHNLTFKGFKVILDSSELPPYDSKSMTKSIILAKEFLKVKISQMDWRDFVYTYYIEINGQKRYEIDLTTQPDIETAAGIFNEQLIKLLDGK